MAKAGALSGPPRMQGPACVPNTRRDGGEKSLFGLQLGLETAPLPSEFVGCRLRRAWLGLSLLSRAICSKVLHENRKPGPATFGANSRLFETKAFLVEAVRKEERNKRGARPSIESGGKPMSPRRKVQTGQFLGLQIGTEAKEVPRHAQS